MATVHIKYNSSAEKTLTYALGHGREDSLTTAHLCESDPKEATKSFKNIRDIHNFKSGNQVAHIRHSFSPSDSQKYPVSLLHDIGVKMAEKYFPGHQFLCVTHTDTPHFHNHIVINTVNFESGKRIDNVFKHWHELKKINDSLCLERGMSIPNQTARLREAKMPDKVQRMNRFGKFSQLMDLKQKADFARSYATGYDEFAGILGELDIRVQVEKKNISYFYPGAKQAKRGANLGRDYDKEGLEKKFQANDIKFQDQWHVRQEVRHKIDALNDGKKTPPRILKSDYSEYTVIPRRQAHLMSVPDHFLQGCMVPIDEIRKAKRSNIIDYCSSNKIPLEKNSDGRNVLKGRNYVEVDSFEWKNTKNNTKGSLIDLVAYHKNISYLQAVSEITNNPRLMLLEEHFGKQKPIYKSFYIPQTERMHSPDAQNKFTRMANFYGFHPSTSDEIYKKGQVQVSKEGMIRIFSEKDGSGAFEFSENEKGDWTHSKVGKFKSPLLKTESKSSTLRIFTDLFSFMRKDQSKIFLPSKKDHSVIALFEPDYSQVDTFLASNKHVKHIEFMDLQKHDSQSKESLFVADLKNITLEQLSIQTKANAKKMFKKLIWD